MAGWRWSCLTGLGDWLKKNKRQTRHLLIQSEIMPKQIVTRWHGFGALGDGCVLIG